MYSNSKKADLFFQLHQDKKLLILPNIWNPMGAMLLQDLGFSAAATASYAMSWDYGVHDGQNRPLDHLIDAFARISEAVDIPVSVDFEKGYAQNDEELTHNIHRLIDAGIVGINIEDIDENGNLSPIQLLADKIKLIKQAASEKQTNFFVNARTDAYLQGNKLSDEDKLKVSIERGKAYQEAGADCIYPMFMKSQKDIETLIEHLDIPVNIKAFPGAIDLKTMEKIGVARVSIGSALFSTAMNSMKKLALELKDYKGLDTISKEGLPSSYLNGLLDKK